MKRAALLWCGLAGIAFAAPPTDFTPKLYADPSGATLIELHVSRCLIKEAEVAPMKYTVEGATDCERINRAARPAREPGLKRMRLTAGRYVFRVYNDDVPWPVDFAIRGAIDMSLPTTGGGQMKAGQGLQYAIDLAPGAYVYSSPLTKSYDYELLVEAPATRPGYGPPIKRPAR